MSGRLSFLLLAISLLTGHFLAACFDFAARSIEPAAVLDGVDNTTTDPGSDMTPTSPSGPTGPTNADIPLSPPPYSATLSVSNLSLSRAQAVSVTITVVRSATFTGLISAAPSSVPANMTIAPLGINGSSGSMMIETSAQSATGTSIIAIVLSGGGLELSLPLQITVVGPDITSATLTTAGITNTQRQVRQGFGVVTLQLTGSKLDLVTAPSVGGLPTTIGQQMPNVLTLSVTVGHGAPTGLKTLTFGSSNGPGELTSAIEVTTIHANVGMGSNSTGDGSRAAPWKTLTQSLTTSGDGDEIFLHDGDYTVAAGEMWPLLFAGDGTMGSSGPQFKNVPNNVTIRGESTAGVVLHGDGSGKVGLAFVQSGEAHNLSLTNFQRAIYTSSGFLNFSQIVSFSNTLDGFVGDGTSQSEISDSIFHDNAESGLRFLRASTASLVNVDCLDNTTNAASTGTGIYAYQNAVVSIQGGLFSGHYQAMNIFCNFGVTSCPSTNIALTITNATITNNTYSGITLQAGALQVGNTAFSANGYGVWLLGTPLSVNFGSPASLGGNTIVNLGVGDTMCINDGRDWLASANGPIASFYGTTCNGATLTHSPSPPMAPVEVNTSGTRLSVPAFPSPSSTYQWLIYNANERLEF